MKQERPTPQYLFRRWDAVWERIHASPRLAVLFDFDGTLVRIAANPNRVRLASRTRRALQQLATRQRVRLAVISGRRRRELQDYIGLRRMEYLGLYGWERNGIAQPPRGQESVSRMVLWLQKELAIYPGVWLEPKQISVSVHLLGTSEEVQRKVRQTVRRLLATEYQSLRVIENLRDLEIVPAAIKGKGDAIRQFLRTPPLRDALPIYFGDDLSDEPAFRAVRRGISVLVGKLRSTQAQFYLKGPAEVTLAILRLERVLR